MYCLLPMRQQRGLVGIPTGEVPSQWVGTPAEHEIPELLGHIDEKFIHVSDIMVPTGDGKEDQCFISRGYDATTHFDATRRHHRRHRPTA